MLAKLNKVFPQPLVAGLLSGLALAGAGGAWLIEGGPVAPAPQLFVAVLLLAGVVAAYRFPIHIGLRRKVEMSTVPIYLLAVLMPHVSVAATVAGLGILAGELMVRRQRGNYYSDVLTNVSRWTVIVLAGGLVGHLPTGGPSAHLLGAALVMGAGELLTYPLLLAPVTGESPFAVLVGSVGESAPVEATQYLLGLLGALAVEAQIWALVLLALPTALVYMAFKSAKEMRTGTRQVLEHLADTVDLRDPYTGGHSRRVAGYTERILEELNVTGPEADLIVAAARVHDIGKIAIPDAVLKKTGQLTPEEEAIMQTHPDRGAEVLARYPDFARGVAIVRHHHERWDGGGYPLGLKDTVIPFGARVIAVADSYDAMTSDRPYRAAMAPEVAITILRNGGGQQWDPQVVDAFLRALPAAAPAEAVRPLAHSGPMEGLALIL
jgi:hypothetical protein